VAPNGFLLEIPAVRCSIYFWNCLGAVAGPADFGMLVTFPSLPGLPASFPCWYGASTGAAPRNIQARLDVVFTLQIIIGSLIYRRFLFCCPLICKLVWYPGILLTCLRVSALSSFSTLRESAGSILYRNMRFKANFRRASLSGISSAVNNCMAYAGYGVWS